MTEELKGKKIAFLVANEGVEQVELTEPWEAVEQAGAEPELIAPEDGQVQAFDHLDKADTFDGRPHGRRTPTRATTTAWCCPAAWRTRTSSAWTSEAVAFARSFFEAGKPVGAICHGPWTLVEADVAARPHRHLVAQPQDRHPQCRRQMGRRGGHRRRGPGDEPQARRPRRLLRQDRRGVRRGRPRRSSARRPSAALEQEHRTARWRVSGVGRTGRRGR